MAEYAGSVAIYEKAKESLRRILMGYFPVENEKKIFKLLEVSFEDSPDLLHDYAAQKAAKISGGDFSISIYGKFELTDKNTGVTQRRQKLLLGKFPRLTSRGTYILAGTEYLLPMQLRLRPGVYVREHADGKTKAAFNLRKGRNFFIYLDPTSSTFKVEVGSSSVKLFPILVGLGLTESEIEGAWGKEVLQTNRAGDSLRELKKLYKLFFFGVEAPQGQIEVQKALLDYFATTELDPSNLQLLMGRSEVHVTPQLMLATSKKILEVLRGTIEEDDRDSLKHKSVADLSNFLVERFKEPVFARKIAQTLQRNLEKQDKPGAILKRSVFERPLRSTFTKIDLARTPRQSNPLDMASDQTAITITGEGGIQTQHAITRNARALNPSHLSFIDPVHTQEGCFSSDTEVFTSSGWMPWPAVNAETQLACRMPKGLEFHKPSALQAYHFTGLMYGLRSGTRTLVEYLVTPEHRIFCSPEHSGANPRIELAKDTHGRTRRFFVDHHPRVGNKNKETRIGRQGRQTGSYKQPQFDYYKTDYDGMVYCATVPGGFLLVRRGKGIGVWLGNSNIGTTTHLTVSTKKEGDNLVSRLLDIKSGKKVELTPVEFAKAYVAFPESYDQSQKRLKPVEGLVEAAHEGKVERVPYSRITHVIPESMYLFDLNTNSIPFLGHNNGVRAMTGAKLLVQAKPLLRREAPFVQTKPSEQALHSIEQIIGKAFSIQSPVDGTVFSIKTNKISIKDKKGKVHEVGIYPTFPLNESNFTEHIPLVKVGDKVSAGKVIADSTHTKNGVLALGVNLRTAYMPYKGLVYEDAVVVSESAAKKLTSEHIYKIYVPKGPEDVFNVNKFSAYFPTLLTTEQKKTLALNGIIKSGTVVHQGDMIAAKLRKVTATTETEALRNISRLLKQDYVNSSVNWNREFPGVVKEVYERKDSFLVLVRTAEPSQVGDKISNLHGGKGTISYVVPDTEIPKDEKGRPLDLIINNSAVVSRMNLGQILETTAGRLADVQKKPYFVTGFGKNWTKQVLSDLKSAGIKDHEEIYDPIENKKIPGILVGSQYIVKLEQRATSKIGSRGAGPGEKYTQDGTPMRGHDGGARAIGLLDTYALLAHGSKHNLSEMFGPKSHLNTEFWRSIETGAPLPAIKANPTTEKFVSMLKGLGIDVEKAGRSYTLSPFLDKDVNKLSQGEIKSAQIIRGKDLIEIPGGLFDPKITGGLRGDKWSHVLLPEALPNPTFETALLSITGLTAKNFRSILAGNLYVDKEGRVSKTPLPGFATGGKGIHKRLSSIDIPSRIRSLKLKSKGLHGAELDKVNKELRFLMGLEKTGTKSTDYLITKVPVIPPVFRPIFELPEGNLRVSDLNEHYRSLVMLSESAKKLKDAPATQEEYKVLNNKIYESLKGVQGWSSGVVGRGGVLGIASILGASNKGRGLIENQLLKRRQEVSGTSVISPDPALKMDEIGIPEFMAWKIFRPFVLREFAGLGYTRIKAAEELDNKTPLARKVLLSIMERKHVILNRAPTLHKFNMMAFKPQLTTGLAILTPPHINAGFNLDHDGDCVLGDLIVVTDVAIMSGMSHTNCSIPQVSIKDISTFPRIESSAVLKASGVVEYDVQEGTYVPAYKDGRMEMRLVTKFSVHPNCAEWEVTTKNGRHIICSSDHSLALLDPETLGVVKAPPRDAAGKCLPVLRSLAEPGLYATTPGVVVLSPRATKMLADVPLNFDAGWFIGASTGDGWISDKTSSSGWVGRYKAQSESQSRAVCLAYGADGVEVRNAWVKIGSTLLPGAKAGDVSMPHEYEGYSCTSSRCAISSTALGLWLEPLMGKGAQGKHLPPKFMEYPNEFRQGLFCGLIDTDGTVSWPASNNTRKKKRFTLNFSTISKDLADGLQLLGLSLGLPASRTTYEHNNKPAYVVNFSNRPIQDARWIRVRHVGKKAALNTFWGENSVEFGRNDFVPMTPQARKELLDHLRDLGASVRPPNRNMPAFSQYVILHREDPTITRMSAEKLLALLAGTAKSKYLAKWFAIALDPTIGWDLVASAQATGKTKTMYDITVPEAWTFTMANGAVVWDTMGVHVPILPGADKEAAQMVPSLHLFKPGHGTLMPGLQHEYVLGLYKLTRTGTKKNITFLSSKALIDSFYANKIKVDDVVKVGRRVTTAGMDLVWEGVPTKYQDRSAPLTAKKITALLSTMATEDSAVYKTTIERWKELGGKYSYLLGSSFLLSDLSSEVPTSRLYDRLGKKPSVKDLLALDTAIKQNIKLGRNSLGANNIQDLVDAGARGNKDQVKQMVASVGLISDHQNRVIPTPIRGNYSQGLSTAEYFLHSYGGRSGMIDKSQSVKDPGYLTKIMLNSAAGFLITALDCHTRNGIAESLDAHILGRFLYKDLAGIGKRNSLVDQQLLDLAIKKELKTLPVRSSLTCEAVHGVCSYCNGLDEKGQLPNLGDHVGIKNVQALTEPTTQLALRTFHLGGVASGKTGLTTDFERVEQLFQMPKEPKNKAVLAKAGGRVSSIKISSLGGWDVLVGNVSHYVPRKRTLAIKVGNLVKPGDALSDGYVSPQELIKHQGIRATQKKLRDDIYGAYLESGIRIDKKTIETPVRMLTETIQILDPGSSREFVAGDITTISKAEAWNKENPTKKPIIYEHRLFGSHQLPLHQLDWAQRLSFERIGKALKELPTMGAVAPVGQSPFAGLLMSDVQSPQTPRQALQERFARGKPVRNKRTASGRR